MLPERERGRWGKERQRRYYQPWVRVRRGQKVGRAQVQILARGEEARMVELETGEALSFEGR